VCHKASVFLLFVLLLITAIATSVESTSAISWSTHVYPLTADPQIDSSSSLMQADDGRIWVVWARREYGYNAIFYKTSSDLGQSWSDKMNLTEYLCDYESTKPSITQTSDGTIWVLWASNMLLPSPPEPDFNLTAAPPSLSIPQNSSDESIITVASLNNFSAPVTLSVMNVPENVSATLNPPVVTPPPDGTVNSTLTVSVGSTAIPGNYTLTVLGQSGKILHNVDIALEITALGVLCPPAWAFASPADATGDWEIYCRTSSDNGATWSDVRPLTHNSVDDLSPSMVQLANGTLCVFWQQMIAAGNDDIVYASSVDNGTSWADPTPLVTDSDVDSSPSATQTHDGTLWVAWTTERDGNWEIYYKYHVGVVWSADERLTRSAGRIDTRPAVLATVDGKIWIFWTSRDASHVSECDDVYYVYSVDGGSAWSHDTPFTTNEHNDQWPSATQTGDVRIWVVWASNRTGNYDIFYRTSLGVEQMGPETDRLRLEVIKSPDPQLIAMQTCEIDVLTDLIRTGDIEALDSDSFTTTAAPGFHIGFIGFNTRANQTYKNALHGSPIAGPVLSDANFRHACFHCYNQEAIVASIYKHIVTPVQSLVPPAQSGWRNVDVRQHPYNLGDPLEDTVYNPVTKENADACSILRYGGYTYSPTEDNWLTPYDLDGDTVLNDYIPSLRLFTPTYEVAPTSAEHGARFVTDCNAVGIPLVHDPRELQPYLGLVYGASGVAGGEFDLFMVFHSLGRFPDHLYNFCHSSQDTRINPGAYNGVGISHPGLDEAVEIVKFDLDHDTKLEAALDAQEMLYDPETYPEVACSYMLLYSSTYFNAFKPGMRGIVNSPGYGSDNTWTFLNMHWEPDHPNERIDGGNSTIIWCLRVEPERHNPCFGHTVYVWEIMGAVMDRLIAVNPYTNQDVPWLATYWTIEAPINETITLDSSWYMGYDETAGERILHKSSGENVCIVNGMKCSYVLRTDVKWQDGNNFTASDAEFNLEFLRNNQIPRYTSTWENIVDVQATGNDFTVYVNETGQFSLYDFAAVAAMLPPPVWAPLDGKPLTEILAYDPASNTTTPTGAGPRFGTDDCPTQLYGTGPYIFEYYDPVGMYAELHANRNYWKSTADIATQKTEMFHDIGDVDRNAEIWGEDKTRYSLAYGCDCYDYCYDADADLNEDCIVDALDGILISWYWGDKKEYP